MEHDACPMKMGGWVSVLYGIRSNLQNLYGRWFLLLFSLSHSIVPKCTRRNKKQYLFALKFNLFQSLFGIPLCSSFSCWNSMGECKTKLGLSCTKRYKFAQIYSKHFYLFDRTNKIDKNMDSKTPAAVIGTTNVPTPIVIKIELPKDVEKQKKADEATKPMKSRLCQLLPILLFVVTFATVLSLLIIYMDPSSEFYLFLDNIFIGSVHLTNFHDYW